MSTSPVQYSTHDRNAPYWAATLIILGTLGLLADFAINTPFWNGYILDMTGPAWHYILVRGLFTTKKDNRWTRLFTPIHTFILFVLVCFSIEGIQYLEWYDSTFDPMDFLAYISILTPLFVIDLFFQEKPNVN